MPRPSAASRAPREHLDELGVLGRDHEVAREREVRADAGRGALHLGDHRYLAVEDRVHRLDRAAQHHAPTVADHLVGRVGGTLGRVGDGGAAAQVGTGAEEAAGRLEHHAADGEVLVGAAEPLAHAHALRGGERVARLGSVDGDAGDAVGDVETDAVELVGVGHGSSSSYMVVGAGRSTGWSGGQIVYSVFL